MSPTLSDTFYGTGVKLDFISGHISIMVALKGPVVSVKPKFNKKGPTFGPCVCQLVRWRLLLDEHARKTSSQPPPDQRSQPMVESPDQSVLAGGPPPCQNTTA